MLIFDSFLVQICALKSPRISILDIFYLLQLLILLLRFFCFTLPLYCWLWGYSMIGLCYLVSELELDLTGMDTWALLSVVNHRQNLVTSIQFGNLPFHPIDLAVACMIIPLWVLLSCLLACYERDSQKELPGLYVLYFLSNNHSCWPLGVEDSFGVCVVNPWWILVAFGLVLWGSHIS